MSKSRQLSPAEIEAFGAEVDAIKQRHLADVGERDASYIRKIEKAVRYTEIAGRGLLMAGIFPPAFVAGATLLGVSKILDNMELGHTSCMVSTTLCKIRALVARRLSGTLGAPPITGAIATTSCTTPTPMCSAKITILAMACCVFSLSKNGSHVSWLTLC